jgi:tRNA modification GTPase
VAAPPSAQQPLRGARPYTSCSGGGGGVQGAEAVRPGRATIYALSSGAPPSAVAVMRVSGPAADGVLRALWPDLAAGRAPLPRPREMRLARLHFPKGSGSGDGGGGGSGSGGARLDRALVVRFPAPRSFTGEPCVELHLHGGPATVAAADAALRALPRGLGVRPAAPGEFARRAFEAGKLELTEVEGLADLVAARSEAQRQLAAAAADGALRRAAATWQERLLRWVGAAGRSGARAFGPQAARPGSPSWAPPGTVTLGLRAH